MQLELHNDPNVYKLARALGISRNAVVGALVRLWAYASGHTLSGLLDLDTETLDAIVDEPGISEALVAVGWLVVGGGGFQVPDFDRWLTSAKQRADARVRTQRHRARTADTPVSRDSNAKRNGAVTKGRKKGTEGERSPSPSTSSSASSSSGGGLGEVAGCRVPDDFELTAERVEVANAEGVRDAALRREWGRFKLHTFARAVHDFDAEWRRWLLNYDPARAPGGGGSGSLVDQNEAALDSVFGPRCPN